jgi:hypothetical protein
MVLNRRPADSEFEHNNRFEITNDMFTAGEDLDDAPPNRLGHDFVDMHSSSVVSWDLHQCQLTT